MSRNYTVKLDSAAKEQLQRYVHMMQNEQDLNPNAAVLNRYTRYVNSYIHTLRYPMREGARGYWIVLTRKT
jgi:hypothetical protein